MKNLIHFLLTLCVIFANTFHAQTIKDQKGRINPDPFDPVTLTRTYKRARIVNTEWFSGFDIGEKIRRADEKCGIGNCIIRVTGDEDFYSPAFTSEHRLIVFEAGTHKSRVPESNVFNTPNYGRVLYPKSNTIILGTSWASRLVEANDAANSPPRHSLIAPANLFIIPDGESTSNITKSENIHVIGLHFVGTGNPANDFGLATVTIGNDDFSSVQDCWFDGTSGYGVSVGGTPGEYVVGAILPDGRTVGFHARNCAVLRNRFENVLTQNLGLITFDGLLVADNLFINPGQFQPDGSYSPFLTVLDVEPNGSPREIVRNYRIIRNTFDLRNSVGSLYHGAIAVQITERTQFNERNEISDNVIWGTENGLSHTVFGIYVNGAATNDLTLNRNYVQNINGAGFILEGKIKADGNILFNAGGGGSPAILAEFLHDSIIKKTTISHDLASRNDDIHERFSNSNNLWEANDFGTLLHLPDSFVTDSIYRRNTATAIIESFNSFNNQLIENSFQR